MVFAYPKLLWLLLILPPLGYWLFARDKKTRPYLHYSDSSYRNVLKKTWRQRLYPTLHVLRLLAVALLVVALARPQSTSKQSSKNIEGVDIVMAMDISGSMLAEDFSPNRLEASKQLAREFVRGRESDRIAVVAFSGEAFTQCPLTIDHGILENRIRQLKSGVITDGTALGDGLAVSINRIRQSDAKSKVIILLTDGVNNAGSIDPLTASDIAKTYGIRVYTIGVGTRGLAPYPYKTPFGIQYQNVQVEIDENLLKQIADETGGTYFRATNKNRLKAIFEEIDKLEKTKIEVLSYEQRAEEFKPFLWAALVLLLLELLLRLSVFKTLP
ncbi:MAG: VWA domain-containing protein [Bacteroidales bacterium]|nr:VWA domain-containing protein [Bacteroidales bacterium]MDE7101329.1 VWA domain-containing protein [Bacteroidales bacterium]